MNLKCEVEIVVCADDLDEVLSKELEVEVDVRRLFWDDYTNDSYKRLYIDELYREGGYSMAVDRENTILKNKIFTVLQEHFPGIEHILVDVSW